MSIQKPYTMTTMTIYTIQRISHVTRTLIVVAVGTNLLPKKQFF